MGRTQVIHFQNVDAIPCDFVLPQGWLETAPGPAVIACHAGRGCVTPGSSVWTRPRGRAVDPAPGVWPATAPGGGAESSRARTAPATPGRAARTTWERPGADPVLRGWLVTAPSVAAGKYPAHTWRCINVGLTLIQRRWRWTNVKSTLIQRPV